MEKWLRAVRDLNITVYQKNIWNQELYRMELHIFEQIPGRDA